VLSFSHFVSSRNAVLSDASDYKAEEYEHI